MTPEYYIENGLRFVKPYYHLHNTTVKRRWVNRTVIDILSDEFRTFEESEYCKRIENGSIWIERRVKRGSETCEGTINRGRCPDTPIPEGYCRIQGQKLMNLQLIDGDRLFRWDHKHERPIKAASMLAKNMKCMKLKIIEENEEVLVVSKPAFIPIHPVQRYYFNSLVEIMKYEAVQLGKVDWNNIRPCHRLDKLTSGLCLFAKTAKVASKIQSDIQNDHVSKTYVARVKGKLTENTVICKDPILVIDAKKGHGGVTLKDAVTEFELLWHDEEANESIVRCKPRTGRTHQIRIHLRNMGCCIKGDPVYGEGGSRSDPSLEIETINKMCSGANKCEEQLINVLKMKQEDKLNSLKTGENCKECSTPLFDSKNVAEDVEMCLHAIKYQHLKNEWTYETEIPDWAINVG